MIDKSRCDDGFIWNPSVCECDCDKSCDAGQYLYYKNYKCRKELIDKLTEECSEDIDGNNRFNATLNEYGKACKSCAIYIVLLVISFLIIIGICCVLLFPLVLQKSNTHTLIC